MEKLKRGIRWVLIAAALSFGGAMLYWALLADVPTARVEFSVPGGSAVELSTPLEPVNPTRGVTLCDVRGGGVWVCSVRQSFWQSPFAAHKTGRIRLGIRDLRRCDPTGRAPTHLRVVDPPTLTVEATPLPDENCAARWDLRVTW